MSPAVAKAIAWIEQSAALLDQASENLKGGGDYLYASARAERLRVVCDRLAKDLKGED